MSSNTTKSNKSSKRATRNEEADSKKASTTQGVQRSTKSRKAKLAKQATLSSFFDLTVRPPPGPIRLNLRPLQPRPLESEGEDGQVAENSKTPTAVQAVKDDAPSKSRSPSLSVEDEAMMLLDSDPASPKQIQFKQPRLSFASIDIDPLDPSTTKRMPLAFAFPPGMTSKGGRLKIMDDLEPEMLAVSLALPLLHSLKPASEPASPIDTWRRLTLEESLDMMEVVQFVRCFGAELLLLEPGMQFGLEQFEDLLFDTSTSFLSLTELYSRLHRLVFPEVHIDPASSQHRLASFLADTAPDLSHLFATAELPSITPAAHVKALSIFIAAVMCTPLFREHLETAEEAMAKMSKDRRARASVRRELESEIARLESGDSGAGGKDGAMEDDEGVESGKQVRARPKEASSSSLFKEPRNDGGSVDRLEMARKELSDIEREDEVWKRENEVLMRSKRSNQPELLGMDRIGRKYWWWEVRGRANGKKEGPEKADKHDQKEKEEGDEEEEEDHGEDDEMDVDSKGEEDAKGSGVEEQPVEKEGPLCFGILVEHVKYEYVETEVEAPAAEPTNNGEPEAKDPQSEPPIATENATSTPDKSTPQPPAKQVHTTITTTYSYIRNLRELQNLFKTLNDRGTRERDLRAGIDTKLRALGLNLSGATIRRRGVRGHLEARLRVEAAFLELEKWLLARGGDVDVPDALASGGRYEKFMAHEIRRVLEELAGLCPGIKVGKVDLGGDVEAAKTFVGKEIRDFVNVDAGRVEQLDAAKTFAAVYAWCFDIFQEIKAQKDAEAERVAAAAAAAAAAGQKKARKAATTAKPVEAPKPKEEEEPQPPMEVVRTRSGRVSSTRRVNPSELSLDDFDDDEEGGSASGKGKDKGRKDGGVRGTRSMRAFVSSSRTGGEATPPVAGVSKRDFSKLCESAVWKEGKGSKSKEGGGSSDVSVAVHALEENTSRPRRKSTNPTPPAPRTSTRTLRSTTTSSKQTTPTTDDDDDDDDFAPSVGVRRSTRQKGKRQSYVDRYEEGGEDEEGSSEVDKRDRKRRKTR
ncbi:hypothetical protein HK104_000530 [Borealophlyctis nickersoniae]|nr:hypothetical protein HK104_000530 [Borealophlyctis nickersoniae]